MELHNRIQVDQVLQRHSPQSHYVSVNYFDHQGIRKQRVTVRRVLSCLVKQQIALKIVGRVRRLQIFMKFLD